MSTALDTRLVPKTLALVAKYGKDAVFAIPAMKTYDPATGLTTEGSVTNHTKKVTPPKPYEQRWVDGDLVQQDDVRVFLPASGLTFTPTKGYQVTIGGTEVFRIVRVRPILTGDDVALYEVQLRG